MFKLFGLLKNYKKEAFLAPFFKLLEAIFDLMVPIIVAYIIDNGIAAGDKKIVALFSVLLVGLACLGIGVAVIAQYFAAKASVKTGSDLRDELIEKIQRFGYKNLDEIGEATLVNRITTDSLQVQTGLNLLLRLALRSPFIVIGSLVAAFLINKQMGYIFAGMVGLITIVVFIINAISVRKYEKIQDKKDNLYSITKDQLDGIRVIKVFGIEDSEYKTFKKANDNFAKLQTKVAKLSSTMSSFNYVVINVGIILILYYGSFKVDLGNITQGQLVALINYCFQILIEILKMTNLFLVIPKSIASLNRINDVLKIEESLKQRANHKIDQNDILEIEFDKVSFSYDKYEEKLVLKDIELRLFKGEQVGIIGGTGSGKTSLLNLIPRYYDTTIGEVYVNGKSVRDYNLASLRKNVSVASQKPVIFKGTIKENIKFGNLRAKQEELNMAINSCEIMPISAQKKNGLNEMLDESGKNISAGQKQRISLARAICKNASVLLLDEPFANLDSEVENKILTNIKALYRDKLLVIASSKISTVKSLDRIIVLDEGEIVGEGTHDELLKKCDIYKELYLSQSK